MTEEQVIQRLKHANPGLFGDLMLPRTENIAGVESMVRVNAQFAETQVVEHVTLFRVSRAQPTPALPVR